MLLRTEQRLQISAEFLLLILWFAYLNGWALLSMILAAAVIHELGHLGMLRFLGARILSLRIGILGAVLETDCRNLSYGGELVSVLAGPAVNLLPIRPLDGGRGLELLVTWLFGPFAGEAAVRWVSAAAALLLATVLGWLMWTTGGSLWLLPALAGLVGVTGRELLGKG